MQPEGLPYRASTTLAGDRYGAALQAAFLGTWFPRAAPWAAIDSGLQPGALLARTATFIPPRALPAYDKNGLRPICSPQQTRCILLALSRYHLNLSMALGLTHKLSGRRKSRIQEQLAGRQT